MGRDDSNIAVKCRAEAEISPSFIFTIVCYKRRLNNSLTEAIHLKKMALQKAELVTGHSISYAEYMNGIPIIIMTQETLFLPPQRTRQHSAEEINRAMARFPFLIEILGELNRETVPCPGDADLRHGCERALTTMLQELARIGPAPLGNRTTAEEIALNWLHHPEARKLIDADKLERMQQFIESILGQKS